MIEWIVDKIKQYIESQQPEKVKIPIQKDNGNKPPFVKK